jgi:hypothetical protein
MSLDSIITVPPDGRQSETALAIARGTQRLLLALGLSCVSELSLLSGRRADLVALGGDGEIWIVEIKSSVADFRADQKWTDYRLHCNRLFFATAAHVPLDIFPIEAGLILADGYGAELVREAPAHPLRQPPPRARGLRAPTTRATFRRLNFRKATSAPAWRGCAEGYGGAC